MTAARRRCGRRPARRAATRARRRGRGAGRCAPRRGHGLSLPRRSDSHRRSPAVQYRRPRQVRMVDLHGHPTGVGVARVARPRRGAARTCSTATWAPRSQPDARARSQSAYLGTPLSGRQSAGWLLRALDRRCPGDVDQCAAPPPVAARDLRRRPPRRGARHAARLHARVDVAPSSKVAATTAAVPDATAASADRSVADDMERARAVRRSRTHQIAATVSRRRCGPAGLEAEALEPGGHGVGGQLEALGELVDGEPELDAVAQLLVDPGVHGVPSVTAVRAASGGGGSSATRLRRRPAAGARTTSSPVSPMVVPATAPVSPRSAGSSTGSGGAGRLVEPLAGRRAPGRGRSSARTGAATAGGTRHTARSSSGSRGRRRRRGRRPGG